MSCDIDNILCQIKTIEALKVIRKNLPNFIEEMPELANLQAKITEKLDLSQADVRQALLQCGNLEERIEPKTEDRIREVFEEEE